MTLSLIYLGLVLAVYVAAGRRLASPTVQIAAYAAVPFFFKPSLHEWASISYLLPLPQGVPALGLSMLATYMLVGLCVVLFARSISPTPVCSPSSARTWDVPLPAIVLIAITPPALISLAFWTGVDITSPIMVRRFLSWKGMFYLLQPSFCFAAIVSCRASDSRSDTREVKLLWLGLVLEYVIFGLASGYAGFLITMVLGAILYLDISRRIQGWRWAAILVPFIIIHSVIYLDYRTKALRLEASYVESAMAVFQDPGRWTTALNRFDQYEAFVLGYSYMSTNGGQGAKPLLDALAQPVPRALWEDKPRTFSSVLTEKLIPQAYNVGSTANFNSLNEFTYAFGVIGGVVVGGILFGLILLVATRLCERSNHDRWEALRYVSVLQPALITGFLVGFVNEAAIPILIINYVTFHSVIRAVGPSLRQVGLSLPGHPFPGTRPDWPARQLGPTSIN